MSFSFVKVCPACGSEFRETVESCPDCGVPLVVKPPEMDDSAFRQVEGPTSRLASSPHLETVVETDLENTKGLMAELDDAGIRFRVERLRPPDARSLSPAFGIPADAGSYAIRVGAGDLAAARQVWERYLQSQVPEGFAETREGKCPGCGSFVAAARAECPECGLALS